MHVSTHSGGTSFNNQSTPNVSCEQSNSLGSITVTTATVSGSTASYHPYNSGRDQDTTRQYRDCPISSAPSSGGDDQGHHHHHHQQQQQQQESQQRSQQSQQHGAIVTTECDTELEIPASVISSVGKYHQHSATAVRQLYVVGPVSYAGGNANAQITATSNNVKGQAYNSSNFASESANHHASSSSGNQQQDPSSNHSNSMISQTSSGNSSTVPSSVTVSTTASVAAAAVVAAAAAAASVNTSNGSTNQPRQHPKKRKFDLAELEEMESHRGSVGTTGPSPADTGGGGTTLINGSNTSTKG